MCEFRFDYSSSLGRFIGSEVVSVPFPGELPVKYAGNQISIAMHRAGEDHYSAELTDELAAQLESGVLEYTFDIDSVNGGDGFTAIVIYTPA